MTKKILSLLVSALMFFSLNACKDDEAIEEITDITSEIDSVYDAQDESESTTVITEDSGETVAASTDVASDSESTTVASKNPSELTKAEIIEIYKNAAVKSRSSVTSQHSVEITKISINGEELGGAFNFIKSIISTFISNNSEDTQGITGGYKYLSEADVYSAKTYISGNETVIELVMKEQTDGAKGDIHGGSVGHVIDVVGDISTVTDELTELGLPIEISGETTTIHYTNPVVKVVIDGDGKIVRGTWRYTVEIKLGKFKAFGADVDDASIMMDNIITVNGGL